MSNVHTVWTKSEDGLWNPDIYDLIVLNDDVNEHHLFCCETRAADSQTQRHGSWKTSRMP